MSRLGSLDTRAAHLSLNNIAASGTQEIQTMFSGHMLDTWSQFAATYRRTGAASRGRKDPVDYPETAPRLRIRDSRTEYLSDVCCLITRVTSAIFGEELA